MKLKRVTWLETLGANKGAKYALTQTVSQPGVWHCIALFPSCISISVIVTVTDAVFYCL